VLYNVLSSSTNIIRMISRRMRYAGQIARRGDMKNAYKIFIKRQERNHLEYLDVYGGIILKCILNKYRLHSSGSVTGYCTHGKEHSVVHKTRKFLTSRATVSFLRRPRMFSTYSTTGQDKTQGLV
jgi:hypothetical protein